MFGMSVLNASGIGMWSCPGCPDRAKMAAPDIDIYKHKINKRFYLVVDTSNKYGMSPRRIFTVHLDVYWRLETDIYSSLPEPSILRSNPLELLIMTGKTESQWIDITRWQSYKYWGIRDNMAKMIDNEPKLTRTQSQFYYQAHGKSWYYMLGKWVSIHYEHNDLVKVLYDLADDATPLEFLLLTGRDFYKSIKRLR